MKVNAMNENHIFAEYLMLVSVLSKLVPINSHAILEVVISVTRMITVTVIISLVKYHWYLSY